MSHYLDALRSYCVARPNEACPLDYRDGRWVCLRCGAMSDPTTEGPAPGRISRLKRFLRRLMGKS